MRSIWKGEGVFYIVVFWSVRMGSICTDGGAMEPSGRFGRAMRTRRKEGGRQEGRKEGRSGRRCAKENENPHLGVVKKNIC